MPAGCVASAVQGRSLPELVEHSIGLPNLRPQAALAAPAYLSAATVKDYLPEAEGLPGFRAYTPDGKKTPAIRAGVIKPEPEFYTFAVVRRFGPF